MTLNMVLTSSQHPKVEKPKIDEKCQTTTYVKLDSYSDSYSDGKSRVL